jgi:hypothetical protein
MKGAFINLFFALGVFSLLTPALKTTAHQAVGFVIYLFSFFLHLALVYCPQNMHPAQQECSCLRNS